jgi:hypothetical protein
MPKTQAVHLAVLFLVAGWQLVAAQSGRSWTPVDVSKLTGIIQAYCKSPAAAKRTCGWAADQERAVLASGGVKLQPRGLVLPGAKAGSGGIVLPTEWKGCTSCPGTSANDLIMLPSLACSGPAIVRTVFKVKNPGGGPIDIQLWAGQGPPAGRIVRCELQLPPGPPATEVQRALASKEINCVACGYRMGGCLSKPGVWYSDSTQLNLSGCKAPKDAAKSFEYNIDPDNGNGLPTIHVAGEASILLAKFEVCNDPGCYNPVLEAKKLQAAGR